MYHLLLVFEAMDPGNHKEQAQKLTTMLENQGYIVQRGTYNYITKERCNLMETCFANNPSSPYGIVFLPEAPGEDTSTYSNWAEVLSEVVDGITMSATYRLDASETIVILGQTPPSSLYYSYIPYVFDRWHPFRWSPPWDADNPKCPEVTDRDGSRCDHFASIANPINVVNMKTSMEGGQSFNSAFAIFMGGDMTQVENLKKMRLEYNHLFTTYLGFPLN